MTTEQRKAAHERAEIDDKVTALAEAVLQLSYVVDRLSGMIPMTCEDSKEIADELSKALSYSYAISEGFMPDDD